MGRVWPWGVGALAVGLAAVRPFRVEVRGRSMEPTLRPGDWLVATRRGRRAKGRVVVVADPRTGMDLVKRIVAMPGDVVDGRTLARDEFLVVGDHPSASTDGRTFGPVRAAAIEGVVRLRYRPSLRIVDSGTRSQKRRRNRDR